MQLGRRRLALQVLEQSWRAGPHPETSRAYAQLDPSETPAQRLQRIETRLVPLRRDHPELLVLQGETAMQAEQWDVARSRLEAALAAEPSARVYRLLAELERHAGNPGRAQEWLAKAADAPADKAWVCGDTGEILPAWQPFGPDGGFDTVHWSVPPRVATMIGNGSTSYILPREAAERRDDDAEVGRDDSRPQHPASEAAPASAAAAS
jgi:HemY protein